jgi:hypothetical protein
MNLYDFELFIFKVKQFFLQIGANIFTTWVLPEKYIQVTVNHIYVNIHFKHIIGSSLSASP